MNEIDKDNFKFCLGLAGVMIFAILVFDGIPNLIMWIIEKLLRLKIK